MTQPVIGWAFSLEPDACRLISTSPTTHNVGLSSKGGLQHDQHEYKRAAGRAFLCTLMQCTSRLILSGLYQRLPDPLPNLALLPSQTLMLLPRHTFFFSMPICHLCKGISTRIEPNCFYRLSFETITLKYQMVVRPGTPFKSLEN
jgi:hypothetical protein